MQQVDVLIIGGGQAGLASAYYALKSNKSCLVIEKNNRIGDQWRQRYDSLVLFASRRYSHIPGLKMLGDQTGYPCKNEVANYLEHYVDHFEIPVQTNSTVTQVKQTGDSFIATINLDQQIHCRAVIIATGGFQKPNVPDYATSLPTSLEQFTPANYQRPSQLPHGTVLVVGDGATGRQVAKEIVETRETHLATGQKRKIKPQQIFGKDYFWWLDKLGILKVTKNSWFGQYMIKYPPFPGVELKDSDLKKRDITLQSRLKKIEGHTAHFSCGKTLEIDAVIWSLGYHFDDSWLKIEHAFENDHLIEERGITKVPGVYTIGRPWQWTRGSSTLTGVGDDADYIVKHCVNFLDARYSSRQKQTDTTLKMQTI